ncbi:MULTISPECIES: phosphatidate cytidylyltransferase [unclassified Mucilaginibacter]|uniref:phosphatidate cytidylyltransferase n=1 Tax=unclassified Mucilaginibacter TaxID=2617802 RepID=UPI0031F628DD
MKKLVFPTLFSMLLFLSSCEIVGGIFKAGFYVGVSIVVLIVILIIYLILKFRGGSNR